VSDILLTQYSGAILGPIAKGLGWIMDGIYKIVYNLTGIENISISIILMTILIYVCLTPLTYKQQKFSKLSQKMNPEIQAIQKKYAGKKDQLSMQKMQEETQAVYEKYGVSPTGSCIQLLIQMPILFALYRVFYNVPAYLGSVKDAFSELVSGIMNIDGYQSTMTAFVEKMNLASVGADFTVTDKTALSNYIIDVIYKMKSSGWDELAKDFPSLTNQISSTHDVLNHVNNFFGLTISETPWNIMTSSFKGGAILMAVFALLIPVLSYLTQILNIKLMPQASTSDNDQMARQMKSMNMMMPLMSFVICFTVPVGLGLYWIAGALVRTVQQLLINKRIANLDLDDIIKKNQEKAKKKREKMGISENQIINNAKLSTKKNVNLNNNLSLEEKEEMLQKAAEIKAGARPNSLAAKANLVKEFNERNNK
jgi:YidC/Oxa1 family membrane protein insertase